MEPDIQRELIPRDEALHLIGTLTSLKSECLDYAKQWQLLDESGHVPAELSFTELFQHATDAQDLSREVLRLTADFGRSPHSANRAGRATLAHLATASTMSTRASSHFAETAETALGLPNSSSPTDRQYRKNRMVIDHATARGHLRRTSVALRDAVKELDDHLDFHRFFRAHSHRESPVPPPLPRVSPRHR